MTSLPVLSSLSRPSDLFTSTAPYILTISLHNRPEIPKLVVNCSHEPTLKLLKGYLETWGKTTSYLKSRLTLIESNICGGMMDTLVVEPSVSQHDVNPTIVLAFIEGVVGYKMVSSTGSYWMYRRSTQFT